MNLHENGNHIDCVDGARRPQEVEEKPDSGIISKSHITVGGDLMVSGLTTRGGRETDAPVFPLSSPGVLRRVPSSRRPGHFFLVITICKYRDDSVCFYEQSERSYSNNCNHIPPSSFPPPFLLLLRSCVIFYLLFVGFVDIGPRAPCHKRRQSYTYRAVAYGVIKIVYCCLCSYK